MTKKSINKITLFNILSTILLKGIALFTAPYFSRVLGTANYGIFSVFNTWVIVFSTIFGLQTSSTIAPSRAVIKDEEQSKYQSSILTLSLCSFSIFYLLMLILHSPMEYLLKMDGWMFVFLLLNAFGSYIVEFLNLKYIYEFEAKKNFLISISISISGVILSIFLINVISNENNYWGRIIGNGLPVIVFGIIACVVLIIKGHTFYDKRFWSYCLPLALPIIFHGLSNIILNQCDRIMLQNMMDDSSVGIYSLAFNFANIMNVIYAAMNNSWVPFFHDYARSNQLDLMIKKARNYIELFTVLSCGFILLSPEVYSIFADKSYWGGKMIIPMLVLGFYYVFMYSFPVNAEFNAQKTKLIAIVTVCASICNIILNWFMIKWWGIYGAAVATALSHGLQFAFHHICAKHIVKARSYVIPLKFILSGMMVFLFIMVISMTVIKDTWFIRWSLALAIGIVEFMKIMKRKAVF